MPDSEKVFKLIALYATAFAKNPNVILKKSFRICLFLIKVNDESSFLDDDPFRPTSFFN